MRNKRHPDFYIGQVDGQGFVTVLERTRDIQTVGFGLEGFVYYAPSRLRLRVNNGVEYRTPRDIKEARELRRKWIAKHTSIGQTVKGVRSITTKLFSELNADRFEGRVALTSREALDRTYHTDKGYVLVENHWHLFWDTDCDVAFGPEFGNLTLGTINAALKREAVFAVFPRKDAVPL